jgi:hypothetical protein
MKSILMRVIMVVVALWIGCEAANAQKWLNKMQKGLDKASSKVEKVANKVESATNQVNEVLGVSDGTQEEGQTVANQDSVKNSLLTPMTFDVKKVIETDDEGNKLLNEDGTERVRYLLIDQDGKICDATTAQKLVSKRMSQYGKIVGKTVGGAATGAAVGAIGSLIAGKSKKKVLKAAGIGALAGTALGVAWSSKEMSNISTLNKSLGNYKNTIAAYQKTFTDEGALVDATVDLSNVDGINFSNVESTTMPSSQIEKELAESKVIGDSLEDIDINTI